MGQGARAPQIHLLPTDSKAIADRSDVISEVPNAPKSKFSEALWELTALPRTLADGVGARYPPPKNSTPAVRPSGLVSTGLRV